MDMKKYAGEIFVRIDYVRDGARRKQIAAVKEGKYDKADVVFETGETLSLNATNTRTLIGAYGRDSDGWIGKEIELYAGEVKVQDKMQPAVLVRPVSHSRKGGSVEGKTIVDNTDSESD